MKQKLSVIYENMNYCVAIVATLVFYVLAHGYRSSNLMFSHDSLQTIYQVEWQHKISLGRYLQPLVWFIRGQLTMPWLVDIGAVVLMITSVAMVVRIFEVKKYWIVVCISGVMCTNVAFTFTNATFVHESDSYMLALFCSLLAVYINNNYKFGFLIGAIPLFVSIGLYQAYIQCAIIIFIIQIILKIVDNDDNNIKNIITFCVKALCTVFLGCLIYFICYKIVLLTTNVKISTAENSMGSITGYSLNEIVHLIIGAYSSFVGAFVFPESYNPCYILSVVNCLIGLFTFIGIINSSKLFARKFDINYDKEIVDKIYGYVIQFDNN